MKQRAAIIIFICTLALGLFMFSQVVEGGQSGASGCRQGAKP